jgi:hypothetical protein
VSRIILRTSGRASGDGEHPGRVLKAETQPVLGRKSCSTFSSSLLSVPLSSMRASPFVMTPARSILGMIPILNATRRLRAEAHSVRQAIRIPRSNPPTGASQQGGSRLFRSGRTVRTADSQCEMLAASKPESEPEAAATRNLRPIAFLSGMSRRAESFKMAIGLNAPLKSRRFPDSSAPSSSRVSTAMRRSHRSWRKPDGGVHDPQ